MSFETIGAIGVLGLISAVWLATEFEHLDARFCFVLVFGFASMAVVGLAFGADFRVMVTTDEHVEWSSFAVDYDSTKVRFIEAEHGADVGGRMGGIVTNDGPGTTGWPVWNGAMNRHALSNFIGEYGPGEALEAMRFQVEYLEGDIAWKWDRLDPPGNAPTHLIVSGPAYLSPGDLELVDFPGDPGAGSTRIWIEAIDPASVLPVERSTWAGIKAVWR